MATVTPIPPNIVNKTGPLLIGYLVNFGLFGVLSIQTYLYRLSFPNDAKKLKVLVYGVYVVEMVQTLMVAHDAMQTFGYGFGDLDAVDSVQTIWFHSGVLSGIIACVIQNYFAYRIYILSHSKIIPAVVSLLAWTQCVAAIAMSVMAETNGSTSKVAIDKTMLPIAVLWLGGSALCDILIALTMTYMLSGYDGGFRKTQDRINQIIRLTMETGSLTATFATVDLILFTVSPSVVYHMCLSIILAKMYSNSLLVIFNSRIRNSTLQGQQADLSFVCNNLEHQNTDTRMEQATSDDAIETMHQSISIDRMVYNIKPSGSSNV
ncbi:hypothetical protein E1B28_008112 [Marasmius oreades]|uniref:DUF6534 domain-containing protein n=1 Tax=Marasmius oreades TaxID=181124 RepID=A0A9P7RXU8_9AGAR|nr:uncharacterized protein E1B28_008112 [Marasmius oreades]KAG7091710.1 hypothetical protein E1B28_008112 [Marasmius oreades]